MNDVEISRRAIQDRLFPGGVPSLWCPTLTHFQAAKTPDANRVRQHMRHLAPHVRGILVPGSTGEGWEMDEADVRRLLEVVLDIAFDFDIRVLLGILKTDTDSVIASIESMRDLLVHPAVVGITVCPPQGELLTQLQLETALRQVLQCGLPTAIYQLPQVTRNEMSPETVASLANEFANFILFKDTSGEDRVALSGREHGGVFMVRGAERGGYAHWSRAAGGPYDGFLLSTANAFAAELSQILAFERQGEFAKAETLSCRLEKVTTDAFGMVQDLSCGNVFANANKILDQAFAFGEEAIHQPPPMLFSGLRLPEETIEQIVSLLKRHDLLPKIGYLEL